MQDEFHSLVTGGGALDEAVDEARGAEEVDAIEVPRKIAIGVGALSELDWVGLGWAGLAWPGLG